MKLIIKKQKKFKTKEEKNGDQCGRLFEIILYCKLEEREIKWNTERVRETKCERYR